jgi:hypothetical protein
MGNASPPTTSMSIKTCAQRSFQNSKPVSGKLYVLLAVLQACTLLTSLSDETSLVLEQNHMTNHGAHRQKIMILQAL